jgi:predicted MFS family arabinose efflux permease
MEDRLSIPGETIANPLQPASISMGMTLLLSSACGLAAANVYYSQPLVGPIGADLRLAPSLAGLIVTMTQIGYGAGLIFIAPLGDLVENRRLALCIVGGGAAALAAAGVATQAPEFLVAAFLVGLGSVVVQVLVPYAAHLAPPAARGRVVGNVTGGLMLGIMLARPVASLITAASSWRMVFFVAAGVMVLVGAALAHALPPRKPASNLSYRALLASMLRLAATTPVLQRRTIYQAFLFGAFSLFWTTAPLLLTGPDFRLSQAGVGLFALAGAAGAIAAPIAGRLADRGWSRPATGLAMLAVGLAFLITRLMAPGSTIALACLVFAAILLDFGVQANGVLGQRAIFALDAEARSRLNSLYIASFFVVGAIGSALGAYSYARGGWALASLIGVALPAMALLCFSTERRQAPAREASR